MNTSVILKSHNHYGSNAPPAPVGEIIRWIPAAVQASTAMAFRGRSAAKGRKPIWLKQMSDIRLVDYRGDEDTVLEFTCPTLGEAAPELYDQKEFSWTQRPAPSDTGFDLLGDVLHDIATQDRESVRFDQTLLKKISSAKRAFNGVFQELDLIGNRHSLAAPAILNAEIIRHAVELSDETPRSQRVRLVGTLDMVRASTQTFAVKLDDGEEARGVLTTGDVGAKKHLIEKRVLILGRAVYRPSGRLLRIDADLVEETSNELSIFSRLPTPRAHKVGVHDAFQRQSSKRGVAAIVGQWPGNETDEEIEAVLQELS